jgi:hypothetical protein
MIDLFGTVDEPASPVTFDDWYSIYPRKRGKAVAARKWKSRGLDAIADKIMAHTQASIEHEWPETPLQFIPHASTYIHQSRFEDEIEIAAEPIPRAKDLDDLVEYAVKRGIEAKRGESAKDFRYRVVGLAG